MNTPETMQAHQEWVNERIDLQNKLTQWEINVEQYQNLAILASDNIIIKYNLFLINSSYGRTTST